MSHMSIKDFYINLDNGHYDYSIHLITSDLYSISKEYSESNNDDELVVCERERSAFAISKSFDLKSDKEKGTLNGLGPKSSFPQINEKGINELVHWPDLINLSNEDFEYFEKRYKECKNRYARIQYGLLIFFGKRTIYSKHKDFKKSLFNDLFELSQTYLALSNSSEKNYFILDYIDTMKTAFTLAEKTKLSAEVEQLVDLIFHIHQSWDLTKQGTLRILLDLSSIMIDNFKLFKTKIDFNQIIEKNVLGAEELEKNYVWGAIYCIDCSIGIAQKIEKDVKKLIYYKAHLYVKLSEEAEKNGNMACVSFTEEALRLFQQLNDGGKIKELEELYTAQRGKFSLSEFSQFLPEETTNKIQQGIIDIIEKSDNNQILYHLVFTPWYPTIESIKSQAESLKKGSFLRSMFGTFIVDKFGNKIDIFQTEEEKEQLRFWEVYTFNFQIGTQTMLQFFLRGFYEKKITYDSIISFLEETWYNDNIYRNYHSNSVQIKPIDILKPVIRSLFRELDSSSEDDSYLIDYVSITDSMVLKIESILRYICEKLGIATFKTRQKSSDKLVMEKLLDDLLVDIKNTESNPTGFSEEDRIFIKYVLTEKAGMNLRNQVAHGLLDIYEYSLQNIVVVFSIILKLSKYDFINYQKATAN